MKQYKPTANKLKKSRKDGKILKSQLLTQGFVVIMGLTTGILYISFSFLRIEKLVKYCLVDSLELFASCTYEYANICLEIIFISLIASSLTAIAIEFFQVRWMFEPSLAKVKLDRVNIIASVKRIPQNFKSQIIKAIASVCALTSGFFIVLLFIENIELFSSKSIVFAEFESILIRLLYAGIIILLATGFFEYLQKRKEYYKELSMDHNEVRQENKDTDGDPYVKSSREQQHRALLEEELVSRVRKSRVVLVN